MLAHVVHAQLSMLSDANHRMCWATSMLLQCQHGMGIHFRFWPGEHTWPQRQVSQHHDVPHATVYSTITTIV